jgi:hypothetical protein
MSESPKPYKPRCMFLTCKAMMVYGEDFESDPDFEAGAVDFTCTLTCQCQGPDGALVGLVACSNPERACFREY